MLYWWVISFIEGMLFYAFSEIIELQEANIDKNSKTVNLLQDIKSLNAFDTKSANKKAQTQQLVCLPN
jgi:hypothetical protein